MGWRGLALWALVGVWWALSAGSNVVGALALGAGVLPLQLAAAQLLAAALLTPLLQRASARAATSEAAAVSAKALLPLAAAKLATTLCSHFSIWKIPVVYAHTVKASTPLWTALLLRWVWGERQGWGVCGSLALLLLGVLLTAGDSGSWDSPGDSLDRLGLLAAAAAAALTALQHVYSARVLHRGGDAAELLARVSRMAAAAAVPLAVVRHGWPRWSSHAWLLLGADVALAWLQALVALLLLQRVSALAYGVLGAAKRVLVGAAGLLLLKEMAPPRRAVGMAVTAVAVLAYNRAKARNKHAPRPLLPM